MPQIDLETAKAILSHFSPERPLVLTPMIYDALAKDPDMADMMQRCSRQTEMAGS